MLPAGARVVVPEIEFTSNLFPWLVHADRGITVDTVPLETRLSLHLYTTEADVDRALEAMASG